MKTKPINLIVGGYGTGVVFGLGFIIAGTTTAHRYLTEIGATLLIAGVCIGSLPLLAVLFSRLRRRQGPAGERKS
jgi:hypothetical protein